MRADEADATTMSAVLMIRRGDDLDLGPTMGRTNTHRVRRIMKTGTSLNHGQDQ